MSNDQNSATVKETLIINDKSVLTSNPDYQLRFSLNLNGLVASSDGNGGYNLSQSSEATPIMHIATPIIEDNNKLSGTVSLQIEGNEAIYTIDKTFVDTASFPLFPARVRLELAYKSLTSRLPGSILRLLFQATVISLTALYIYHVIIQRLDTLQFREQVWLRHL